MKCNQSGQIYKAKVTSLCTEDMNSITAADLIEGKQLMMDYNKKSYPVTVMKVVTLQDESKNGMYAYVDYV